MERASHVLIGLLVLWLPAEDANMNLKHLSVELPVLQKPSGKYMHVSRTGNRLYLSGKGPRTANGQVVTGRIGETLSVDEGYTAARLAAIQLLSAIQTETGDLNYVQRIIKVNGYVNCPANFAAHSEVMNGCSDLLLAVFGERGKHARTTVGVNSLPGRMAVEIEMIVELKN